MSFDGNEGAQISLQEGAELTMRYRTNHPQSVKGVFYGRTHLETLLAQPGCVGIRMYFAQEADNSETLVLVGVDSTGNDMLNIVIENGTKCPTICGATNPLNSGLKDGLR